MGVHTLPPAGQTRLLRLADEVLWAPTPTPRHLWLLPCSDRVRLLQNRKGFSGPFQKTSADPWFTS